MRLLDSLLNRLPFGEAYAHCDIPCGIYDPITAKIAAQTVQKMVLRMESMQDGVSDASSLATLSRYTAVKEQHADLVKHEVDVLWHDYFKPEHLEKYPDLHTTVWETTKAASANKQNVDMDSAKQLVELVDKIATIFWATKGVDYKDTVSEVRFGT
jgi:nickel superoxide dismutase